MMVFHFLVYGIRTCWDKSGSNYPPATPSGTFHERPFLLSFRILRAYFGHCSKPTNALHCTNRVSTLPQLSLMTFLWQAGPLLQVLERLKSVNKSKRMLPKSVQERLMPGIENRWRRSPGQRGWSHVCRTDCQGKLEERDLPRSFAQALRGHRAS